MSRNPLQQSGFQKPKNPPQQAALQMPKLNQQIVVVPQVGNAKILKTSSIDEPP
jgi:hypothetical protein